MKMTVVPESDCALVRRRDRYDTHEIAVVQLKSVLARKQEKTFAIALNMDDEQGTAQPFCSKFIDDYYPNGLTMRVILQRAPKKVKKEILPSEHSDAPLWTKDEVTSDTTLEWIIRRPVLGRVYYMSWEP